MPAVSWTVCGSPASCPAQEAGGKLGPVRPDRQRPCLPHLRANSWGKGEEAEGTQLKGVSGSESLFGAHDTGAQAPLPRDSEVRSGLLCIFV